jgi:hypothetical protein
MRRRGMDKEFCDYIKCKRGGMGISREEKCEAFAVLIPSNEVTQISYLICLGRNGHSSSSLKSVIAVGQILDRDILEKPPYQKSR